MEQNCLLIQRSSLAWRWIFYVAQRTGNLVDLHILHTLFKKAEALNDFTNQRFIDT